jgi:tetratricopeptide (TPR) repeat protein
MKRICCALVAFAGLSLHAQDAPAQPPGAPTRDQQLSMQLSRADQTKVMGKLPEAIALYEDALAQAKAEPDLNRREEEVLQRLSAAYIAAQRPADAVRVSRRVLGFHAEDCKPGAPGVERCADAQYGLGLALMYASDFAGAVTQLTASAANFGKVGMEGDETFRMTKTKQCGDAQALLAAALFRAGQKEKAVATFRKAIATLHVVADNAKLDPGTRGSAQKSLQDAESSLKLLDPK